MAKRRFGDRKDAALVRDIDGMHFIMPLIYPNRCDNEAFISERIDLTKLNEYLEKKNAGSPEYKYNIFQVIVTSVLKTIMLRPKMNRFIANKNLYQRNDVTASFVVKKVFSDDGGEGLAVVKAEENSTIDTIHNEIFRQVSTARNGSGSTEDSMDFFNKMPRFLGKLIVKFICVLDRHGKVPQSLIAEDPYYQSVVLTNLGSIKLHSGYHHLTNWGTNSVFVIVGERKVRPFWDENGNMTMRDSIDIGLTVDERIGDGYYFSGTVRLLKKLIENPELLEDELSKEIEL
ncbi:MAG: 2-oxo acid dehydrogenase subunit E2 [Clostridia bacterium]|nr:2-oxo acid dehydrogenase subunit E2 [Clostridia bacterium]